MGCLNCFLCGINFSGVFVVPRVYLIFGSVPSLIEGLCVFVLGWVLLLVSMF